MEHADKKGRKMKPQQAVGGGGCCRWQMLLETQSLLLDAENKGSSHASSKRLSAENKRAFSHDSAIGCVVGLFVCLFVYHCWYDDDEGFDESNEMVVLATSLASSSAGSFIFWSLVWCLLTCHHHHHHHHLDYRSHLLALVSFLGHMLIGVLSSRRIGLHSNVPFKLVTIACGC